MLEHIYCYECGEELKDDDTMYDIGSGERVCEDCRYTSYYDCEDCGALVHSDDAQRVYRRDNEQLVCPDCLHDYTYCEHCGEYVTDAEIWINTFRLTICEYCYHENYFTCEHCNETHHVDAAHYINDSYYCMDCADDIEDHDLIHPYSYSPPELHFYGAALGRPVGYGAEVEIDDGDDRWDAARDIDDAGDGHIYLKEDGSLSYDGLEIVTHPATLDYHVNSFPWGNICSAALNYGYRSHDTNTCGLHIHASRSMFGGTTIEQDLTIAKIMLLIDRWYDTKIVNFARRDINKMRRWADKPNADIQPGDDDGDAVYKSKKNANDRYRAINLCNYSTVEFRFFRGTLKHTTIIASIQWVDTIINYCKRTPLKDLFRATWDDIFATTGHPELTAYLKQRNLYNLKKDVI